MVSVWGGERPLSPPPSGTSNVLASPPSAVGSGEDLGHLPVPENPTLVGAEMALATHAHSGWYCESRDEVISHREVFPGAGICHPDVASGAADKGSPLFAAAHSQESELSFGSHLSAQLRTCESAQVAHTPPGRLLQAGESHHGEDYGAVVRDLSLATAAGPDVGDAIGTSHSCAMGAIDSLPRAACNQLGDPSPTLDYGPSGMVLPQELSPLGKILHEETWDYGYSCVSMRPGPCVLRLPASS